jgi:sterol desaturase/sphingolipid hydroxylase (fatty acid hydroxylase superfamily)
MLMLALTPFPTLVIVFFAGIIVFHLLEPLAPIHKTYRAGVTRRGYLADVISLIVNGPGLDGLTTLFAMGLVLLLPAQIQLMPQLGWWGQFVVFFLVNDFLRYWIHRWYHESDLLWRIHRVHHTIVEMDAMSVFRFHILEGVIKNFIITLPFQLLGVDEWVVVAYSAIDITKGFWHHANLRTYIGPLNYVLNSGELHWWHHSVESRGQRSNYGSTLSIWDWMFGTAYWPRGQWPDRIGVDGLDAFPNDYLGQFTSPAHPDADYQQPAARELHRPARVPKPVMTNS